MGVSENKKKHIALLDAIVAQSAATLVQIEKPCPVIRPIAQTRWCRTEASFEGPFRLQKWTLQGLGFMPSSD